MACCKLIIVQICLLFVLTLGYQYHINSRLNENFHDNTTGTKWINTSKATLKYIQEKSKVKIKVYYETLCPASVDFFTSQLRPVVEKLAQHVDVHLIPYGHAKTWRVRGRYKFRCQHGPAECYGNKLQACAVDALQNTTQAVLFNACLLQYSQYSPDVGFDYASVLNWCGFKLHVFIHGVWQCVNSERGSILLKGYGEETRRLRPKYVPYVMLDDSTEQQDQATGHLMSTVCGMLNPVPTACYML